MHLFQRYSDHGALQKIAQTDQQIVNAKLKHIPGVNLWPSKTDSKASKGVK